MHAHLQAFRYVDGVATGENAHLSHCINHLEAQPTSVRNATPILVRALVAAPFQELVDNVTIASVDLDAIEAAVYGGARGLPEGSDEVGDLRHRHRPRVLELKRLEGEGTQAC